jgi:hypothetical protein
MEADLLFTCSVVISVVNTKLGELHLRYLKGLNQPYSLVTAHTDNLIREIYPANLFRRLNIKPILKNS